GGICNIRPTIRGTFDSINDGYDPTVNSVEVAAAAGSRLRKNVQKNATVEKVGNVAPSPSLTEYLDVATGQVNTRIDGGSIGQIDGTSLNFDSEQADEGLFLKDNIAATPVKVTVIQKASSSQIVFMVPDGEVSAESAYLLLRRRNKTDGPIVEGQSETMEFNPASVAV
ncbi:MAG: DUF4469 domain-containing protein, partial [Sedimentisphaerales bacterium]|nr:DUF4469 domain-containing protein [Sedimentisphaerales bacterium]